MPELLILVDEYDNQIGTMEKMQAHREGKLHRAFSVFVFNNKGQLLLQRRALHKYHSGGLWTNTCCSHQRPGETTLAAAHRRLQEEVGFDCPLAEKFTFVYQASFSNGLTEYEFDHVLFGATETEGHPNPQEVSELRWIDIASLEKELSAHPELYTFWLKTCLPSIIKTLNP